ncbi:LOW QUALITY PROTEIN: hypothetical protein M8C21_005039, partial [Ambrosia artemisiifolia]
WTSKLERNKATAITSSTKVHNHHHHHGIPLPIEQEIPPVAAIVEEDILMEGSVRLSADHVVALLPNKIFVIFCPLGVLQQKEKDGNEEMCGLSDLDFLLVNHIII